MKLYLIAMFDKIAQKVIDIRCTTDTPETIAQVNYQYILDNPKQHMTLARFQHIHIGTVDPETLKLKAIKPTLIYDMELGVKEARKQLERMKEYATQSEQEKSTKDVQA